MRYSEVLLFLRTNYYHEVEQIHDSADFLVRGDTITAWLISKPAPLRFEFFDEELEQVSRKTHDSWEK